MITLCLGAMALLRPSAAAAFTGIEPSGKIGISEIRATYGGLFFALGAIALYQQSPIVFLSLGIAWLGAAAGRIVSIVIGDSREAKNFAAVAFEAAIGLLLFIRP